VVCMRPPAVVPVGKDRRDGMQHLSVAALLCALC
jgi:hypothetical protein